jgi:MarR family 2-MHQ and catechol resistance regulon transcriptional repressor
MKKKNSREAVHTWLIWIKATRRLRGMRQRKFSRPDRVSLTSRCWRYSYTKALPVNTIGPTVNLTTGSISVAVDRLHRRGLRSGCAEDRRVRIVELTRKGRELTLPVFQRHCETMIQMIWKQFSGESGSTRKSSAPRARK